MKARVGVIAAVLLVALGACKTGDEKPEPLHPDEPVPGEPPADAPPEVIGPLRAGTYTEAHPVSVVGDGGELVEEQAEDCLWIEPTEDKGLLFDFMLVQTNGHTCSMTGVAQPDGVNQWVFIGPAEEGVDTSAAECKLLIKVSERAITLEDVDGVCRQTWCGARAAIEQTDFARVNHKEGNLCSQDR